MLLLRDSCQLWQRARFLQSDSRCDLWINKVTKNNNLWMCHTPINMKAAIHHIIINDFFDTASHTNSLKLLARQSQNMIRNQMVTFLRSSFNCHQVYMASDLEYCHLYTYTTVRNDRDLNYIYKANCMTAQLIKLTILTRHLFVRLQFSKLE